MLEGWQTCPSLAAQRGYPIPKCKQTMVTISGILHYVAAMHTDEQDLARRISTCSSFLFLASRSACFQAGIGSDMTLKDMGNNIVSYKQASCLLTQNKLLQSGRDDTIDYGT
jgi:hypothetical protein